jgi:hypothetical protein
MKVSQLLKVIEAAGQMYRERGDPSITKSLNEFAEFCADYQSMTVASFAKLIAKNAVSESTRDRT